MGHKKSSTAHSNYTAPKKPNKLWALIKKGFDRYFVKAMSGMAMGLFASLIIGLILSQLSKIPFLSFLGEFATVVAASSPVVGAAIGVGSAYYMKVRPLVIFSSAVVGAIGYNLGGPVGCFVATVVGAELGNLVAGRTPVDIVLVPIVTIVSGGLVGKFIGPSINQFMTDLGALINEATQLHKLPMGILVSAIMGLALTAPISSAALAISLNLEGLAAGAACVGCCCQMVGFAVASFRENRWGGLLSQGLGTSMLQVPNIMRHPAILLAPTISSMILGPISTCLLGMTNNAMGAGMGTSGLVGPIGAFTVMRETLPLWQTLMEISAMHFLLPALLTLLLSEALRRLGWVKFGDQKLQLN